MDRAFQDAINLLSNATEAFTAALFLYEDEAREHLKLRTWHSLSKNVAPGVVLGLSEGLIGWVAKTGQPVQLPRFDRDTKSLGFYTQDEDIKSFLAVPVGQAGVLCVDSKQQYVFTEKDLKILKGFSQVFLHLVEGVETRRREKNYARMLRLLYRVEKIIREVSSAGSLVEAAMAEMKEFAGADLAAFTTPNQSRTRYRIEAVDGLVSPNFEGTSYAWDSGLVGWVYKQNKPLALKRVNGDDRRSYIFSPDDPIKQFQSFVGLPLMLWGSTVGVLGLASYQARDWSTDDIQILTMTGQWVASALGALTT